MRLLVLGASGRTGQLVTADALKRGHTVTALVRNPDSLQAQPGLHPIKGSPLSSQDLDSVFTTTPVDAVIITLATSLASGNPFSELVSPRFFMRDSAKNVIAAMQRHGVRKLVVMSAFGAGSSFMQLPFPLRWLFRHSNMSYQFEDHDAVDVEVRNAAGLEWTLVRPPMLKHGEKKDVKEFGETGEGIGMLDAITRETVAKFMVDAAEKNDWVKRAVVIVN